MTPEAQEFMHSTIQRLRQRVLSNRYQIWRQEDGGDILWRRDLMLIGSVLLPEPTSPSTELLSFYLNFDYVRRLIGNEVDIQPRNFIRHVNKSLWTSAIRMGDIEGNFGDRFYHVVTRSDGSYGANVVPTDEEKNAPMSPYGQHTITLPEFTSVTHDMRLAAIGL